MKKAVFLAVCITLIAAAPAMSLSVPTLINYQGVLTDANGNLITGTLTKTMIFAVYDAAGVMKWGPETQTVQIISGQFNVLLGSVLSNPAITTAFDGPDRYLSIKVDNVELLPRQQILSTGYAVQAERANTVEGSNLYVNPANGNVGVGTTAPESKLTVNGMIHSKSGGVKFPDGSVKLSARNCVTATRTQSFTTSSSSWVDVPDLSVNIITHGGPVLITVNINSNPLTSNGWMKLTIVRDSINLGNSQYGLQIAQSYSAGHNGPATMVFVDTPSEGPHTYKVQIASGYGTLEVCESGQIAQIAAIEL